jgi:ABC-type antimicrobial peptide transport system permease subunit
VNISVQAAVRLVLVSAAVTLLTVVVIASYLPARRAAAIDPIRALQEL